MKKLTEKQIKEIISLYIKGISRHKIADEYKIHYTYPSKLAKKRGVVIPNNRNFRYPLRKLNDKQVKQIILKVLKGMTHKEISKEYNIHPSTISKIVTGRRWKYLFQPQEKEIKKEVLKIKTL